jgi:kynurenine formamidase
MESEKIVDLSNPIEEGMPIWPQYAADEANRLYPIKWAARDGDNTEWTEMTTHTGTHVDCPYHLKETGATQDEYPVEKYMGEGIVIDVSPKKPGGHVTEDDIDQYAGEINAEDVVMLHTGWDEHYGRTTEYLFEYPFLHPDAAQRLADLEIKAAGIDSMSFGGWTFEAPNHGPATDISARDSHEPLLGNDIVLIEELRNLDKVLEGESSNRAYFCFPPLNYQSTGGGNTRAFAIL